MSRLLVIAILLTLTAPHTLDAYAQESTHTLFAVDLSLTARQRITAYDVIQEVTLNAPTTHIIGLTLFDDTVRRFVEPASLDADQIRAINDAMADSLVSVRSTSNLAVGIERAIDNTELNEPANLVVFARGVIDTPTQDPRARFSEWLELVLLPQAAQENIKITLVIPDSQSADPVITHAFESSEAHNIVTYTPGAFAAPELVSLLGIADRPYGENDLSLSSVTESSTPTDLQVNDGAVTVVENDTAMEGASDTPTPTPDVWFIAKILLLTIAITLLCGFVYWRSRTRKTASRQAHTTTKSSTYLPLTEKPSSTMNSWKKDEAVSKNAQSLDNRSPSRRETPALSPAAKSIKSKQEDKEPWE